MNILHLSQTDIRTDSRILKEMNTLAESDSSYKVSGIGVKRDKAARSADDVENLYIQTIVLSSGSLKYIPRIALHALSVAEITFRMLLKAVRFKPDIVHCNDTPVLPLGIILKLLTGAKVVYDAHELESDRNSLSKNAGKITLFVEKILWRYVDALIVVSPSIQRWYTDNIGEKLSEVILNSPVLGEAGQEVDDDYLRDKYSIPDESKIFLYIGILGHGRSIDLMVDAFKQSDRTSHLVFLGYGEMSDSLEEISSEYSNIHVHEAVSHERVVSVAKSADVGMCLIQNVSLSDYYCLPNKLFEYCFAEIPVLASNFPDISAVVDKYELGRCSDLDSASIVSAVYEFEMLDKLPEIDSRGLYELSWQAQEEKLIELYGKLTNRTNQGE